MGDNKYENGKEIENNSIYYSKEIKLIPFEEKKKWGYLNNEGAIVINPVFDAADYFMEGVAGIKISDFWGFINEEGKIVIQPEFSYVGNFYRGFALVDKNEKLQLINKEGLVIKVIDTKYKINSQMSEGLIRIYKDSHFGYVDYMGDIVVDSQYMDAGVYSNGLAWVKNNDGETYYINRFGEKVIELSGYTIGESFSQGLAVIRDNYLLKAGYINKLGQIIINPQFGNASFFSEGLAVITKQGKKGYIDSKGELLIQTRFDVALPFIREVALVAIDGNYGFINKKGMYVAYPIKFDYVDMESYTTNCDLIKVFIDGKASYLNRQSGNLVFELLE